MTRVAHSACPSVLRRHFLGLSPDIVFYWQPQAGPVGRFYSSETSRCLLLLQAPQILELPFTWLWGVEGTPSCCPRSRNSLSLYESVYREGLTLRVTLEYHWAKQKGVLSIFGFQLEPSMEFQKYRRNSSQHLLPLIENMILRIHPNQLLPIQYSGNTISVAASSLQNWHE